MLLPHHAEKTKRADIDGVLGSNAISGSADNIFMLRRTERYRVMKSVQRIGPDMEETVLHLDEQTGNITAGPTRREADQAHLETALLRQLEKARAALVAREWMEMVDARRQLCLGAIRSLIGQGKVARTGNGKKGEPYLYSCSPVPS